MIKVGERLPEGKLKEFIEAETPGCSLGPNEFDVSTLTRGKTIVVFGLPGAFTPTCSAKHVPGYVANHDELRAKGVDEIWCVSVNDAFVMGAWGRDQKSQGKVRMMADGGAQFTRALGLEQDIAGMGTRSKRYAMLVKDGVVKTLDVEAPGKFEVSDAASMLKRVGELPDPRFKEAVTGPAGEPGHRRRSPRPPSYQAYS
jgi:glutaredoxin/glutathione-dependent peroxiredoxin